MQELLRGRTKALVVGAMVLITGAHYASTLAQFLDTPTTANLNPAHVQLVVHTDPQFLKQFSILAMEDLRKAGIVVRGVEDTSVHTPAKLLLTLTQEPMNGVCPGMVSYEASLALIEDVVLERTGEVIKDSTWEGTQPPFVRRQRVTAQGMERDLHELIGRFIVNFKLGNPPTSSLPSSPQDIEQGKKNLDADSQRPIGKVPARAPLRNLNLDLVYFSSRAGALGKPLHDRALAMASREGIDLQKAQGGNNLLLSLYLDYGKSEEGCAGTDIYSARLALDELVRIRRPPGLYVWTSTWVRQITRVSAPPSKEQLEKDSDELLGQFIAAYKAENPPSPNGKNGDKVQ